MDKLWDHQQKTIDFAVNKSAAGIFSGMGSGKTRTAIEIVKQRGHKLILVVCPKACLESEVWPQQFELYMKDVSHLSVSLANGTVQKRADFLTYTLQKLPATYALIVVVNYDSVWRGQLADKILKIQWDCVIADESHRIKAAGSQVSRFFAKLSNTKQKLALSGTPCPNSPLDVYGQYRWLDKTIFGTNFTNFSGNYAIFGGYQNRQILKYKNLNQLRQKMASISIRFETNDVIDLPPMQHLTRYCTLNTEALKAYKTLQTEFVLELANGNRIVPPNALVKGLRCQQLTSGVAVFDSDHVQILSTDKLDLLKEVLSELPTNLTDSGITLEPVIVFCKFRYDIDACKKALIDYGYSVGEISGEKKELQAFQNGSVNALVVQIDSGSESIDLTRASYAIYYSLTWSNGIFEQSQARIHRPGQTKPTRFIYLLAANTIDQHIYRALQSKQQVNEYLMKVYNS